MKNTVRIITFLLAVICICGVFTGEVFAATTYKDTDLKIGEILHYGSFVDMSVDACVRYYESAKEEKAFQTFDCAAGRDLCIKSFIETFDWVVLENYVDGNKRYISLYPYVNNGIGGVEVRGLAEDETVLHSSWLDFVDCNGKTKTVRYYKDGEALPFYTQTSSDRYMRVLKRSETSSFDAVGYGVSYWHVKNVDTYSGTLDLIAGRDIGFADMIKANEMYRTQIVPAGTLIDYSAARYVSFHFYTSEYTYDKGNEFYCFDYYDRKDGEERFIVAGAGYSYPAYVVMSANTSHVHLVALDSRYPMPDESSVDGNDLIAGDVVYNGSVLTYRGEVKYCSSDGTLISSITNPDGFTVANPEGVSASSWVVSAKDDYEMELVPLNFSAEGLLIPSNANQNESYSGACVKVGGKNYYYYDMLSVAIADAKANKTPVSMNDFVGNNKFNSDNDRDKAVLLKNVNIVEANVGAVKGVAKGIVIDFNGHSASGVSVGPLPENETLVFINSKEKKSYITGPDAFIDKNENKERTGTVVFSNLNIASKIYPAMHTIYLFNGEYLLNSATVMDKGNDSNIIKDTETCPLYKFYEDYPYWTCSITPKDPTLNYPNGKKVEKNGKTYYFYTDTELAESELQSGDVINNGNKIPARPNIGGSTVETEDTVSDTTAISDTSGNSNTGIIITVAIIAVVAIGAAVIVIIAVKKKKQ